MTYQTYEYNNIIFLIPSQDNNCIIINLILIIYLSILSLCLLLEVA